LCPVYGNLTGAISMRRTALIVVLATAAGLASAGKASSADLGLPPIYRAPPPAYGPIYGGRALYDWTACYVGLNAGGVWGRVRNDWSSNSEIDPAVVSSVQTKDIDASGFTGGGGVGCNWQVTTVVWGVEADFEYTGLDESRDLFVPATAIGPALQFHEDFSSKWLATFRGRLGWLATPFVLLYATGGLAVANVETADSLINGSNPAEFFSVSGSETRAGWTVGAGAEWKFAPHWSVKAEYLFVDLGQFHTTSADSLDPSATIDHDHHLTENLVRAGVNFHF
jgi:outer membrane immunogenic protein